ncbi:hypothetical protein [Desulfatitalea tepidiphila]|uniref:hypothetical protein n=1 Tax=Desulfatitalea tepidiphila TaxID=1185843 RepID=UPI0006B5DA41|nr:hypothetical protein [Desulfatitalea tepidiphila]
MKRKTIILTSVLIVAIALHVLARFNTDNHRTDYVYRLHASVLPFPTEMIKALAGEFKGMVANYLLLEASAFIGSEQSPAAGAEEWDAVARLMDQSSQLDPYFKSTYRLAQTTLPWEVQKFDETLAILERSKEHRPWDWEPGFFIGFDYYYFLNDRLKASEKLMEAYTVPGAPPFLITLASRLASQAGHTRTAIEFLTAIYEKTDDERLKKSLSDRIMALEGVVLLQSAVDIFHSKYDRYPHTLDELVEKSILPDLPVHPYNRTYTLKDGRVDF